MQNDWNADDTQAERTLRHAVAGLRRELAAVIGEARGCLDALDAGQRPSSGLVSTVVLRSAPQADGYAAQVQALLNALPGDGDRDAHVLDIVRLAGK